MKKIKLPEIPRSWLVAGVMIMLVALRAIGIDTYITAALSSIVGYVIGRDSGKIQTLLYK